MKKYTISRKFVVPVIATNKQTGQVRKTKHIHTWYSDILLDITEALTEKLEDEATSQDWEFSIDTNNTTTFSGWVIEDED